MLLKINTLIYPPEIVEDFLAESREAAQFKIEKQVRAHWIIRAEKIQPDYRENFTEEFFNQLLIKKLESR
jgi:hypothetical protein